MIARISRTVLAHVAVLVEAVKRRRGERRRFAASPIGEPAKRPGWDDDPDSLSGFWPVRVPDQSDVDVPEPGRHSSGSAA